MISVSVLLSQDNVPFSDKGSILLRTQKHNFALVLVNDLAAAEKIWDNPQTPKFPSAAKVKAGGAISPFITFAALKNEKSI